MRQLIPYEKLSKRQQREFDMRSRNVWAISPVTRRSKNPKVYNRTKMRQRDHEAET